MGLIKASKTQAGANNYIYECSCGMHLIRICKGGRPRKESRKERASVVIDPVLKSKLNVVLRSMTYQPSFSKWIEVQMREAIERYEHEHGEIEELL